MKRHLTISVLTALILPYAGDALSLPGDEEQEIIINADHNEFFLEEGREKVIYYGSEEQPAAFRQGSLRISGTRVTIERLDGMVSRVTSTGRPARFQQRPAPDQAIVYAQGLDLIFDNANNTVTMEGEGELEQAGLHVSGAEITIEGFDGMLRKVKTVGAPARVQHQPAEDEPITHAKGLDIVLDNDGQLITIAGDGELTHDGIILSGHRIEWNLEQQNGRAFGRDPSERTRTIISPRRDN